ncbi:hypothetical protein ACKQTC_00005 [Peptococcus simiae]|uniref:Lipoprotein n=1 Tax=Peptococcus simiae TaxID=1643805 RepID=A0ABW9GVF0_9FIRM
MKKRWIFFLALLGLGLVLAAVTMFAGVLADKRAERAEATNMPAAEKAAVEEVAVDFIRSCFVEGSNQADPEPYLAQEASALRRLLTIRQAIQVGRSERNPSITDFQVEDLLSKPLAGDRAEVQVRATSYWGDPDLPEERGGQECHYRLELVRRQDRWQVLKALTDDTTAGFTHPDFFCNPEAFEAYDMTHYDQDIQDLDLEAILADLDGA